MTKRGCDDEIPDQTRKYKDKLAVLTLNYFKFSSRWKVDVKKQ